MIWPQRHGQLQGSCVKSDALKLPGHRMKMSLNMWLRSSWHEYAAYAESKLIRCHANSGICAKHHDLGWSDLPNSASSHMTIGYMSWQAWQLATTLR